MREEWNAASLSSPSTLLWLAVVQPEWPYLRSGHGVILLTKQSPAFKVSFIEIVKRWQSQSSVALNEMTYRICHGWKVCTYLLLKSVSLVTTALETHWFVFLFYMSQLDEKLFESYLVSVLWNLSQYNSQDTSSCDKKKTAKVF